MGHGRDTNAARQVSITHRAKDGTAFIGDGDKLTLQLLDKVIGQKQVGVAHEAEHHVQTMVLDALCQGFVQLHRFEFGVRHDLIPTTQSQPNLRQCRWTP